jgi:hypothetical protein
VGHPAVDNATPFAVEPLFVSDEEGRPIVVPIVKATYEFDLQGHLRLAEKQVRVNLAGEPATDAPLSSYRYEPDVATMKPATDIVLIGHAEPPGRGATYVDVGIRVGPVRKLARVFGDRYWVMAGGSVLMSRPGELARVPLLWELAFGGHDQLHSTPERPLFDARNPVGCGFGRPLSKDSEHARLPNIEDPQELISEYGAAVTPCGFGFTSPNWEPRARFAGTYDAAWEQTRKPLLPVDFDRRFFNAAAPGLVAPGHLTGGEPVVVLNASPGGRLSFALPSVSPPRCTVVIRRAQDTTIDLKLDTVIVNMDERQLLLTWRWFARAGRAAHDVSAIRMHPVN